MHHASPSLPQTPRAFWRAWLWTWINWVVKLGVFAWVFQLFAPVSWPVAGLAAIAGDISSVLPFHGVAGAGTYEAGIVAALLPFNIASDIALAAAVAIALAQVKRNVPFSTSDWLSRIFVAAT